MLRFDNLRADMVKRIAGKASNLLGASIVLMVLAAISTTIRANYLTMFLVVLVACTGIAAIVAGLKAKGTVLQLTISMLWSGMCFFALIYGVKSYYGNRLATAIENGDIDIVKKLVVKGYDVNVASSGGQNMLTLAFWYGTQKKHPFTDSRKIESMTAEHVETTILDVLQILVRNGANMNRLDSHGWAPIHLAAKRNYHRILKMLIEKGADVNLKNTYGSTALHSVAEEPNGSEAVKMLLIAGADVNVANERGSTPLHCSIYSGSAQVVDILLRNGANVNAKDADGKMPLQIAVEQGKTDIADLLRQHGAKE
jgi:ankyrin repeat protein